MIGSYLEFVQSKIIDNRTLEFRLDKACPFFEGHFPGSPILPAFASLQLLTFFWHRLSGASNAIESIAKAKLVKSILPETTYQISFVERPDGTLNFRYSDSADTTLITGRVTLAHDI